MRASVHPLQGYVLSDAEKVQYQNAIQTQQALVEAAFALVGLSNPGT